MSNTNYAQTELINDAKTYEQMGLSWKDCVKSLVSKCIGKNASFSSGEILRAMRLGTQYDFTAPEIGAHIRALYEYGYMPAYSATGWSPVRVGRHNSKGQLVYVYSTDWYTATAHDFEVDIPARKQQALGSILTAKTSQDFQQKTPQQKWEEQDTFLASVQGDKSLSVAGGAFERWAQENGQKIDAGTPVFLRYKHNKAQLRFDVNDGAEGWRAYRLGSNSSYLRTRFSSPAVPFTPGNKYKVAFVRGGLDIDLTESAE